MAIQRLKPSDFGLLENPGVKSVQILWGQNSPESKITVTRVTVTPGASQRRHCHTNSEQVWIIEQGTADLLLDGDRVERMQAGDVIRTPAGETHGIQNLGRVPLIYLAITTPPQDFSSAYQR